MPFEQWWQTIVESRFEGVDGLFVHPVQDPLVMAGNGTIGLELLEDLPDVDTVLVPFGGGGLSTGIASAVKALRPSVKVYGVEPETAARRSRSAFAAGEPVTVDYTPSFVDGSGSKGVLDFDVAVPARGARRRVRRVARRDRRRASGCSPSACA